MFLLCYCMALDAGSGKLDLVGNKILGSNLCDLGGSSKVL